MMIYIPIHHTIPYDILFITLITLLNSLQTPNPPFYHNRINMEESNTNNNNNNQDQAADQPPVTMKRALLIINCIILAIGNCGGPLIMRLYFLHGGKRVWLSGWLQTGCWPIMLLPLSVAYFLRRRHTDTSTSTSTFFLIKRRLFLSAIIIGILTGFDDYLYAYGVARLPVSTSSLVIATQLVFTAGFAYLLVKQRFTPYTVNAVVLLTVGAGVLAMHSSSDRPEGESSKEYVMGFLMTLVAAVLYGLILPLVELAYKKAEQEISYTVVVEFQMVMSLFATLVCTVGMLVNHDFQAIPREARESSLGPTNYYIVLVFSAIIWQTFFLGAVGVIFVGSSMLSGILIAVLLPVTEVFAVIFYSENFQAEKGVSLGLSIWGFISYFYGEFRQSKKKLILDSAPKIQLSETNNQVSSVV